MSLYTHYGYAIDVTTYIPERAYQYLPTVKKEQSKYMPDISDPAYFGALIEHESCVTLSSDRCWNPRAKLKTSREEGAGMMQITRTWDKYGNIRFDSLKAIVVANKNDIGELKWGNVYLRPDLQIRAGILMTRNNYKAFYNISDPMERLRFTDAAYNEGIGNTNRARRICGMRENCNPQLWFNNVADTCATSRKALYMGRSPCDISRHHVIDTTRTRIVKYRKYWHSHYDEPPVTLSLTLPDIYFYINDLNSTYPKHSYNIDYLGY